MNTFVCYNCINNFCQLQQITNDILSGSIKMDPAQFLRMIETQIGIAKELLNDKLAIAHSTLIAGFFLTNFSQNKDLAIQMYEDAYEILKHYEKHKDDYFYNLMVDNYQNNILFLGQGYQMSEQYDKAMKFLQEGLEYDMKLGDKLNIAKDKSAIGSLLRTMKKYEESEKMLLEAIQLKKEAGIAENDRTMLATYMEFVNLYNTTEEAEKANKYMSIIETTFSDFVGRNPQVQQFFKSSREKLNL